MYLNTFINYRRRVSEGKEQVMLFMTIMAAQPHFEMRDNLVTEQQHSNKAGFNPGAEDPGLARQFMLRS